MAENVPAKLRFKKRSRESPCPMPSAVQLPAASPSSKRKHFTRVSLKLRGVPREASPAPSTPVAYKVGSVLVNPLPSVEQQERVAATLSMAPAEVIAWFRAEWPKLQAALVEDARLRQKVVEEGGSARLDAKTVAAAVRCVRMAQIAPAQIAPTSTAPPIPSMA